MIICLLLTPIFNSSLICLYLHKVQILFPSYFYTCNKFMLSKTHWSFVKIYCFGYYCILLRSLLFHESFKRIYYSCTLFIFWLCCRVCVLDWLFSSFGFPMMNILYDISIHKILYFYSTDIISIVIYSDIIEIGVFICG